MDSNPSDDPQTLLISTLRSQIQDLFTQVSQLNGKLVQSYDRVSDLEDDLHTKSTLLRQASVKVSQLELERTQHLSALNTGLLVEKEVVTAELTRLMEKATEEAASRGQAESAKAQIEKELDDLSASLFDQANRMVAEARFEQMKSEEKARSVQEALKGAEEAVGVMQGEVQRLRREKEDREEEVGRLRGKGKWRAVTGGLSGERRLMKAGNAEYGEFLAFVGHLRTLRKGSAQIPAMNTLLPLPFLARLMNEDSDPTIRLDLAPSLNWLSRRTVLAAIHNGNLSIEPLSTGLLLQHTESSTNLNCALCGTAVFSSPSESHQQRSNSLPGISAIGSSWFKRPSNNSTSNAATPTPPPSPPPSHSKPGSSEVQLPSQVYIFRVTVTTSSGATNNSIIPNISIPSSFTPSSAQTPPHPPPPSYTHRTRGRSGTVSQSQSSIGSSYSQMSSSSASHPSGPGALTIGTLASTNSATPGNTPIYPLCTSNYCLARLRATCSLWAFIRVGVVGGVWEEEVGESPKTLTVTGGLPPPVHPSISTGTDAAIAKSVPPVPPRRRGLWGTLTERAGGWSGSRPGTPGAEKEKEKGLPQPPSTGVVHLPPPPPVHPALPTSTGATTTTPAPPPLPKRSQGRRGTADPQPQTETETGVEQKMESEVVFSTTSPPLSPKHPPTSTTATVPNSGTPVVIPSNIPLPESRPGTPQTGVGVGAPPPLPRRAVERERGAGSSSRRASRRDSVLVPAPVLVEEENSTKEKGEGSVDAGTTGKEGKEETEPKTKLESETETKVGEETKPEVKEEEKSVHIPDVASTGTEIDSSKRKEEQSLTEPQPVISEGSENPTLPAESESEPKPKSIDPEVDDTLVVSEPAEPTKNDLEAEVEVKQEVVKVEKESVEAESEPGVTFKEALASLPEPQSSSPPPSSQDLAPVSSDSQPPSSLDPTLHITSSTWEERTWKELVRLREVMFWTRIGASAVGEEEVVVQVSI